MKSTASEPGLNLFNGSQKNATNSLTSLNLNLRSDYKSRDYNCIKGIRKPQDFYSSERFLRTLDILERAIANRSYIPKTTFVPGETY